MRWRKNKTFYKQATTTALTHMGPGGRHWNCHLCAALNFWGLNLENTFSVSCVYFCLSAYIWIPVHEGITANRERKNKPSVLYGFKMLWRKVTVTLVCTWMMSFSDRHNFTYFVLASVILIFVWVRATSVFNFVCPSAMKFSLSVRLQNHSLIRLSFYFNGPCIVLIFFFFLLFQL